MVSTYAGEPERRRTLRRSRFGCRNCKLRKLKCDQGRPLCKRCTSFGVLCNFLSNVSDLQPIAAGTERSMAVSPQLEILPPLSNAVWTSDPSTYYRLNAKCQDFITRYLGRSLINPDDPCMTQVNRKLLELAFTNPYLMHASLAVALTYDRYLNSPSDCRRTPEECFHWYQSTVLLNKRLREPITTKDKDPIWGTAAALALLAFSSPDVCMPEQAWPLNLSGPPDLDWLNMSEGKMALWHIVDPLRPDSLFRVMEATYAQLHSPLPRLGIDGIPTALVAVCDLKDSSTEDDNPYLQAAHAVSRILNLPEPEVTIGHTLLFTGVIHGKFKNLLQWNVLLYAYTCDAIMERTARSKYSFEGSNGDFSLSIETTRQTNSAPRNYVYQLGCRTAVHDPAYILLANDLKEGLTVLPGRPRLYIDLSSY